MDFEAIKFHRRSLMIELLMAIIVVLILVQCSSGRRQYYPLNHTESIEKLMHIGDRQEPYVLSCQKLPHVWVNPSIARIPGDAGAALVVWRMIDKKKQDKVGFIVVKVANGWNVTRSPDMAEYFAFNQPRLVNRWPIVAEDARVFVHDNKLFLVYNTHLARWKLLFYAQIQFSAGKEALYTNSIRHINFEHEAGPRHQKNWCPFDYTHEKAASKISLLSSLSSSSSSLLSTSPNNSTKPNNGNASAAPLLLFVYSIIPHRIVQLLPSSKPDSEMLASTVSVTRLEKENFWPYGELRGGTPAQLVGEKYLTFFHSSEKHLTLKLVVSYFMGAYLFDPHPPFGITHITVEPIIHRSFIDESQPWAYQRVDFVVFPMGYVFNDTHIHVSVGTNDRDGCMLSLNRREFLDSLQPVDSLLVGDSFWDKGMPVPGSYRNKTRDVY